MGNKRASCISNPLCQHIQLQIGTIEWHILHSNLTRNATTKVLEKGLLERWKLDLVASKSEALNSNLSVQNDHVDAMDISIDQGILQYVCYFSPVSCSCYLTTNYFL